MTFNNTLKLLAGALALILVAGMTSPAFAQSTSGTNVPTGNLIAQTAGLAAGDPIVFESNTPQFAIESGRIYQGTAITAEDFALEQDTQITDFHYIGHLNPTGTINYIIYADAPDQPGAILDSGTAQNVDISFVIGSNDLYEIGFYLEVPFAADAGVTYWFGLNCPDCGSVGWQFGGDDGFGNPQWFQFGNDEWFEQPKASWFALSGIIDTQIAGELLPLDNTSLFLAGIQSMTVWMIPTVLGLAGAGVYLVKFRANRD